MGKFLNQNLKTNRAELNREFVAAKPFRHIAIDDFLDMDFARALLVDFPAFNDELAVNENGEVGGKAVHQNIATLGPVWRKLDKLVKGEAFRALISDITGIPAL